MFLLTALLIPRIISASLGYNRKLSQDTFARHAHKYETLDHPPEGLVIAQGSTYDSRN
jgi:hypothetical protein